MGMKSTMSTSQLTIKPMIRPWRKFTLLLLLITLLFFILPYISHPSTSVAALPLGLSGVQFSSARLLELREQVRGMFQHGYESYLTYAFPHDELKPMSKSWTDSLSELGNSKRVHDKYHGVALTMIDSLSTLAVMGNATEFARAVDWIAKNIHFDLDVRVNLFEANIRILGGLLSAHVLALDPALNLHPTYNGALLPLAKDLGDRFLPAFVNVHPYDDVNDTKTTKSSKVQLPYAWINLKHGVEPGETVEQCTAGIGTLLLEFGLLSHLTNDTIYYDVAERSLFSLWRKRNQQTNLIGNSLSCLTGEWSNPNAGIGAGIDSFYEYLLKSYIMFDNIKFLHMWELSYKAVQQYLKYDRDWYIEADMNSGSSTHVQFNSLAGFFPGLQSLVGDFPSATATHEKHFGLWTKFDGVPERYLLQQQSIHSTEKHYILRPEVMESTYFLYRSTRNPIYLEMGWKMFESIETYSRVDGGYASLKDLESKAKEDRMNSFFLAETCKYLYLLFDEANWVHTTNYDSKVNQPNYKSLGGQTGTSSNGNWLFTTEGHIFPILSSVHMKFGDLATNSGRFQANQQESSDTGALVSSGATKSRYSLFASPITKMNSDTRSYYRKWKIQEGVDFSRLASQAKCPRVPKSLMADPNVKKMSTEFYRLATLFALRQSLSNQCLDPNGSHPQRDKNFSQGDFTVSVTEGSFNIVHRPTLEKMEIKNLGTPVVEITNILPLTVPNGTHIAEEEHQIIMRPIVLERTGKSYAYKVTSHVKLSSTFPSKDPKIKQQLKQYEKRCSKEWDGIGAFFGPPPTPPKATTDTTDDKSLPSPVRFSSYNTTNYLIGDIVVGSPIDGCHSPTDLESYRGKIVILQRGTCTFMDKIWAMQTLGAVGVIMVNTDTGETTPATSSSSLTDAQKTAATITASVNSLKILMMGADGSGREITIPSLMIPKQYGDEIIDCLTRYQVLQTILVALNHDYPRPPFQLELIKYQIPPPPAVTIRPHKTMSRTPSTSSSSALHPRVAGDLTRFFVTSMGGWTVELEEKDRAFLLKVY